MTRPPQAPQAGTRDAAGTGNRLAWLDVLRGLAALCVVFNHFGFFVPPWMQAAVYQWINPGDYGVFVFFIISGYIVPASLERRGSEQPIVGPRRRRWRRAHRGHRLAHRAGRRGGTLTTVTVPTGLPSSFSAQASVFRPEVVIAGRETKILIDQVRTIDVSYVTGELIDYLSRDDMAQVEHSLSRYFGLLR